MKNVQHDNQPLYNYLCSGFSTFECPGYQSALIVTEGRRKIHHEYRKENPKERKVREGKRLTAFELRGTAKDLLPQR